MIDNSTLVLFGARGNLAKVKLIPGLFHLDQAGKLPKNMKILSVGRQEVDESEWHSNIKQMLDEKFKSYDENVYERFIKRNYYHANLPDDPEAFIKFAKRLGDKDVFPQNLAFFLSVRPSDFALIVKQLSEVDLLNESEYWRRVLIEKPFGTCLKSAIELQTSIEEHLKEDQIYRIDHYLGKFSLQNIMTTRFKNGVLEPLWSSEHIEQIQITNHETLGVGDRTVFYEATGALRDMIQSHLLQMLALVTMEKPNSMSPEDVRLEKIKLLESIEAIPLDEIENFAFRGQYAAGELNGEKVKGYLEEVEKPDSVVETYAGH
jgi:glucose-6-phosphate 1-dehydrogenase